MTIVQMTQIFPRLGLTDHLNESTERQDKPVAPIQTQAKSFTIVAGKHSTAAIELCQVQRLTYQALLLAELHHRLTPNHHSNATHPRHSRKRHRTWQPEMLYHPQEFWLQFIFSEKCKKMQAWAVPKCRRTSISLRDLVDSTQAPKIITVNMPRLLISEDWWQLEMKSRWNQDHLRSLSPFCQIYAKQQTRKYWRLAPGKAPKGPTKIVWTSMVAQIPWTECMQMLNPKRKVA